MEKQKNRSPQNQTNHPQRRVRQAFKQAPFIGGYKNKHPQVDANSPDNWAIIQPDIDASALHKAPTLAGFGHYPSPSAAAPHAKGSTPSPVPTGAVATNPMEGLLAREQANPTPKSLRVPGAIRFVQPIGNGRSPQPVRLPAYHAPAQPATGLGLVVEFIAQLLGLAENDTGTEDTRHSHDIGFGIGINSSAKSAQSSTSADDKPAISPDAADILMAGLSKHKVSKKAEDSKNATTVSSLNEPTMAFDYYLDESSH